MVAKSRASPDNLAAGAKPFKGVNHMGLLAKLTTLQTALSQIVTLAAQVQAALTTLDDFLDGA